MTIALGKGAISEVQVTYCRRRNECQVRRECQTVTKVFLSPVRTTFYASSCTGCTRHDVDFEIRMSV